MIAPSILNADFAHLADEAAAVAGADWLHVDVMDNHFVPNLTIGLPVVQSLLKATDIPIDCHLMITDPDRWAVGYAEAGAYNVTVHAEAVADPVAMAANLRAAGAKAGLSLKPGTDLDDWVEALKHYDTLLVMTVEPGFGGQSFMADMMGKVRRARTPGRHRAPDRGGQVDGGINADTIEQAAAAGADCFVAGSAVYSAQDPAAAVAALRATAAGPSAGRPDALPASLTAAEATGRRWGSMEPRRRHGRRTSRGLTMFTGHRRGTRRGRRPAGRRWTPPPKAVRVRPGSPSADHWSPRTPVTATRSRSPGSA